MLKYELFQVFTHQYIGEALIPASLISFHLSGQLLHVSHLDNFIVFYEFFKFQSSQCFFIILGIVVLLDDNHLGLQLEGPLLE